jgi:3-hydroxyisobutyrate dehydrogenase-like beta-hydroxyacid dehydrogenase
MRVGFVGLGNIGAPMARRLCTPRFDLRVHDVDRKATEAFAGRGCGIAASVGELAAHADVVCICVRDDLQLREVLEGAQGLVANAAQPLVVLIHSTVRPRSVRELAPAAAARGVTLLDAPVTGGAHLAERGELVAMIGGPVAALERARPVLDAFCRNVIHAGGLGSGMVLKAANNLVTMLELVAAHESLKLVERGGVDPVLLHQVMTENGNLTDTMRRFIEFRRDGAQQLGAEAFEAFQVRMGRLVTKDLEVALDVAAEVGLDLPATEVARRLMMSVFLDRDTATEDRHD